jgi:hypothetical protein
LRTSSRLCGRISNVEQRRIRLGDGSDLFGVTKWGLLSGRFRASIQAAQHETRTSTKSATALAIKGTVTTVWQKESGGEQWVSCHVGPTGTHLITKVKQRCVRLVLGWVNPQMTSSPGAVSRCTCILWPGKASEKTPRGVIPPVCVKYRRTP